MTALELLSNLRLKDIEIWADGDRLRYNAPKGVLSPQLRDEIARHKQDLLEHLGREHTAFPPLVPSERGAALPLSFAQQRLWFLHTLGSGGAYNLPLLLALEGTLSTQALARALSAIGERHEALRTTFALVDGEPTQRIGPATELDLPLVDLAGEAPADVEAAAREQAGAFLAAPFDLEQGPVWRAQLLRLAPTRHWLVIAVHHIASDGWSMGVLQRELAALYQAFRAGEPSPLPTLSVQYADFAAWQRQWLSGVRLEQQLAYWRDQLADAPTLHRLPIDRPRPAEQRFVGERLAFSLDAALTAGLRRIGRAHGATLFMTLLAGFTALLARHAGQTDWVIGTPIANRVRRALEPLIGFFVNTLALRLRWDGAPPWSTLLAQVRETALQAYAHQELPFERLVEALNPERSLSHEPLVQILFTLQNAPASGRALEGLEVTRVALATRATRFELECYLREVDDHLVGMWVFNTDLFEASTIELLQGHFQTLLKAVVADPEQQVSRLPLWDEAERRRVLVEWNRTNTAAPLDQTVVALFETQAARTPEATAVVFANQVLSYGELNARANRLARHLLDHADCRDTHNPLIALCLERSVEMIVGLLGILKAGGAYVPLDPACPPVRLAFMLEDSGALLLVTRPELIERIPLDAEQSTTPVYLDRLDPGDLPDSNPTPASSPENLAYVIYTSGSTGKPKGVEITNANLLNLVSWHVETFEVTPSDRATQVAGLSFDAAGWELWPYLLHGAQVVLAPEQELLTIPERLRDWLVAEEITISFLPTPLAESLLPLSWPERTSLRIMLTGGDQLHQYPGPTLPFKLVNNYGPTENTVVTTSGFTEPRPHATGVAPSIGRPIANTQVYVLDAALAPVPIGMPGELCIAGAGLARGYLNRPELTAERFIELPGGRLGRADDAPVRLYRTGDLACWRPNGNLEFLGRIDDQVKLRGFRIELGEIEAALSALPQVTAAAVLAREDRPNDRRLVAYVVLDPHQPAATDILRRALAEQLPDFMIPSAFVPLDALPLNANGKVDRAVLPAPEVNRSAAATAYVAPRTPLEETLAELWKEVLRLSEPPGIHDDFFELGGHSLLAAQLAARIGNSAGKQIDLRALFLAPTIAGLTELLAERTEPTAAAAPLLVRRERSEPLPPSFAQQRLWFLYQLEGASSTYNISQTLRLHGGLNVSALRQSFAALVERHQSLRMCFPKTGDAEVEVRELPLYDPLETIDLSDFAEQEQEEAVQRLTQDKTSQPFDLERGPLLRVTLLVAGEQEWVLLLSVHHIVFDGWSMNVLHRELSQLYSAFDRGEQPAMESLPVQYADYAAWQRQWLQGETLGERMAFWDKYLAGIPELIELPTDSPRPAVQQHQGAAVPIAVDRECTEGLKRFARENGCTLFMVLQAALAVLLSRFSGCRDIVIGTPAASRPRRELEDLIGLFVNTLVLRTSLRDEDSFLDLLARVRRGTLDAYAHQEIPFELLVERLNPKRSLSHHPVFQVMLNLINVERTGWNLPGVQVEQCGSGDRGLAKFDINLGVVESAQGLSGRLDYDASLFRRDTMVFLGQCLSTLLQQAPANATRRLSVLSLLSDEWWRDVARGRAGQQRPTVAHREFGQAEATLVERFLAQVERYPHDLAVVAPEQRWTYRQLDERARQLAAALLPSPPGETWSALLLPHDEAMIVGILGSLMAGRAYLPLNTGHPDAGLRLILADTQANTLVCNGATRERAQALTTPQTILIDLDDLVCEPAAKLPSIDPEAPAYLLFTSGSSGRPKGVMQTHKKVLHFIRQYSDQLRIAHQDRLLQLTRYGFDGGVLDSFSALLNGATLYPFDLRQNSPKACAETIAREQITVYHSSPSFFRELIGVLDRPLDSVRLVVLGGEAAMRRDFLAWRDWFSADGFFVNFYSQTESSVTTVQVFDQSEIGRERVPIGFPVDATQVILAAPETDADAELFGEIVIQSPYLAAGYWKRESDAFSAPAGQAGQQRYRTGDLARRLPDGSLEFLGRLDHQVKLRGFRIELGEIESVLSADPGVSEAVVVVREDRQDDRRLVAYVVLDQHRPAAIDALRRTLAERLPDYMLPNAFVPLDALPLNANGKVDRLALPAPELDRSAAGRAYVAPSNPLEETLADLWQEILMLNEPPGVRDDFFDLGGHSLLSAHLVSRIEADLGLGLNLLQFFSDPTIAGSARTLEQAQSSVPVSKSPSPSKPLGRTQLVAWSHAKELHAKILSYSGSWRGERKTPESLVVGWNTSGTRPPLFWVFQGQQELVQLATYLGKDQPLYGMRSGHLVMKYAEDNIQALAIGYVREIEARCPEGPLFVGGNCQGARIALAIAQHLVRRTRHIPLLFLMEWTYLPTPYAGPVALIFGRESDITNPYVRFRYPELTWRCAFMDFRVEIVTGAHNQFFREPNIQVLAQTIQRCMTTSLLRPPSMLPADARRAEIQVLDPPHELTQGSRYLLNVHVTNPTEVAWPSGEASGLMVANRWVSASGALLCELDACAPLPPLAPGDSRSINLPVLTPAVPETVELLATVTQEGVRSHNAGFGNLRVQIKLVEGPKVLQSPAPDLLDRYQDPVLLIGESDAANRELAVLVRAQGVFVLGEAEQSDSSGIANASWLRRLLPYWNKELPEIVRQAVVNDLDEWLDAAFASRKDARQQKTWGWVNPANALLLPILLDFWPALRVIQVVCDTPETADFRDTEQLDMLAPVVLNRDELVLPPAERSVRIRKHLSSKLAVNVERLMPYNHLQLRLEDLSSDPNTTLARVLGFLERKRNHDGGVSRTRPAQEPTRRQRPQVAASNSPMTTEQIVSRHPSSPDPDPRALLPIMGASSAPEESIAQGEEAWHRGDFLTAINTLGEVAQSTDSILPKLADALFKKGHYDEALLRFRQALASDETNAELWLGLAQAQLALGQRTEAAAGLHRALDLDLPQPVRALNSMMSMQHDVLAPARAALERNPHDIGLLVLLAHLELACGNGAEARGKAQRLSELFPDRVDLVTPVTEKLIEQGRLDEAQTLLEPLARDLPEDPEIAHLMGLLTAKANDDANQTATAAQVSQQPIEELHSRLARERAQKQHVLGLRNQALHKLNQIQTSATGRLARPLFALESRWPRFIRGIAVLPKLAWWTMTLRLPQRLRMRRFANELLSTGLFDSTWYVESNPDVVLYGQNPIVHWITCGWTEGRDPNPLFDTDWYLAQNPDVAKARMNPLAHYLASGAAEGRDPHPLFDSDWYLTQNADVAKAGVNPLAHYLASGAAEGRDPNPQFDSDWYLAQNRDVAEAGMNPLVHYLASGAAKGRDPNPRDKE